MDTVRCVHSLICENIIWIGLCIIVDNEHVWPTSRVIIGRWVAGIIPDRGGFHLWCSLYGFSYQHSGIVHSALSIRFWVCILS